MRFIFGAVLGLGLIESSAFAAHSLPVGECYQDLVCVHPASAKSVSVAQCKASLTELGGTLGSWKSGGKCIPEAPVGVAVSVAAGKDGSKTIIVQNTRTKQMYATTCIVQPDGASSCGDWYTPIGDGPNNCAIYPDGHNSCGDYAPASPSNCTVAPDGRNSCGSTYLNGNGGEDANNCTISPNGHVNCP